MKAVLGWMIFCLCFTFLAVGNAQGATSDPIAVTATITWDHPQPELVKGFVLRVNGTDYIDIPGEDVREWEGEVTIHEGENTFDMQAYDREGTHSEWSVPVIYILIPDLLPPTNVTIIITIKIQHP